MLADHCGLKSFPKQLDLDEKCTAITDKDENICVGSCLFAYVVVIYKLWRYLKVSVGTILTIATIWLTNH